MKYSCSQCGKSKKRREFFHDKRTKNGLHAECKSCTKEAKKHWAKENVAYTRVYALGVYYGKKIRKERRPRQNKEITRLKISARGIVYLALKAGILVRKPCVICGNPKSEAHHPNHRFPLKVVWLCRRDHEKVEHGRIKLVHGAQRMAKGISKSPRH